MADIVDRETRSRMMSGIRGSDTKPELMLHKALHARGLRYRLHTKMLPGKPDLVFPKFKAVVFVHGCFWHRHGGCRFTTNPATRPEFWAKKFEQNVARDKAVQSALRDLGWKVAIIWECALRSDSTTAVANNVEVWLKEINVGLEIPSDRVSVEHFAQPKD